MTNAESRGLVGVGDDDDTMSSLGQRLGDGENVTFDSSDVGIEKV